MTESTGSPTTGETPDPADGEGSTGTRPLELPDEAPGTPGYTVPPKDDERGVEGVADEPTE